MVFTEPDWRGHESNPDGKVHIGKNTEIREYAIINKPTGTTTYIGDDCYIMNNTFIGHDSHLGNGVQLNPGCTVAGFVTIGNYTHIGMNASVHQRSIIGNYCMIGASSFFKGESPDGIVWGGVPAIPLKVNTIAIERSGLSYTEKQSMIETAEKFVHSFKSSRNV